MPVSFAHRLLRASVATFAFVVPAARADDFVPPAWPKRPSACERVVDISFPDDTTFPYTLDFATGRTDLRDGDRIVIREVRGTRPTFEVGGIYLVRGEYTLASLPETRLRLTVTASRRGDGCTKGNGRGTVSVSRGSGTFELASPIAYPGWPHVWFGTGNTSSGGVYFGAGDFLRK
jgi:hypothetical protein